MKTESSLCNAVLLIVLSTYVEAFACRKPICDPAMSYIKLQLHFEWLKPIMEACVEPYKMSKGLRNFGPPNINSAGEYPVDEWIEVLYA